MATIKDVAKLAKVSKATVSRYINNKGVSKKTSQVIEKAIKELNFVPSKIAQGLSNQESNLLAIIVPDLANPFFCEIVNIIQLKANKDAYNCMIFSTNDDLNKENEALETAEKFRVKGIIIATSSIRELPILSVPIIAIDRKIDNCIKNIIVDNYKIGQDIAKYFYNKNKSNILYISGSDKVNTSIERIKGFEDYCSKNDINYKIVITSYSDAYKVNSDYKKIDDINKYDGIFMGNEIIALSLFNVGLSDDIVKLTIDGTYLSKFLFDSIACIKQPIKEMASLAYQNIIKWEDKKEIIELKVGEISNG